MKFRSKEQIQKDYPFVTERAKELTAVFGGYASVKVFHNGEQVFSWSKQQKYVVPKRTILDRDGYQRDMTRKPHKWNDGINRRGERER